MMETGVTLEWLLTGSGEKHQDNGTTSTSVVRKSLIRGELIDAGYVLLDKSLFIEPRTFPNKPQLVVDSDTQYIVDLHLELVSDGLWLVNIEGKISVRSLTRIPVKRLKVEGAGVAFDCNIDDITVLGRVVLTIQ
ncbi:transcriptional regulator [Brenneria uluponensis]|uniref:transcriptional regulator n=1 Tax=Brenneria uluponensis TaxID=3057057 RepID=UPI0028F00156|nr:transcriptional regulator [Brenneria ulupoensis]